jgi:hypothetical protein
MKLCLKILTVIIVATSMISLIGCAAPAHFSYSNVTVSIAYQACSSNCAAIVYNPSNGAMANPIYNAYPNINCTFISTTVTNAPANITYSIYPTPNLVYTEPLPSGTIYTEFSPVGTVNYGSGGTGNADYFCPPIAVPIYKGAALEQANALGIPQGDVMIVAGVPNNPNTPSSSCVLPGSAGCSIATSLIQIYNSAGMTSAQLFMDPSSAAGYTAPINFTVSTTTAATPFTATTANGSNTLTAVSSIANLVVGEPVTGTGIPASTTITAVGTNTVTLSANATSNNTGETVTGASQDVLTMVSPAVTTSLGFTATGGVISGPGIPAGTTVTAINTGSIVISAAATAISPAVSVLEGAYSQTAVTVTHDTTFQFTGFAVGAPPCLTPATCLIGLPGSAISYPLYTMDNKVDWLVGPNLATAVVNGSATFGTISGTGLYTAPPTIPPTNPVLVVMESDFLYSSYLDAYVTIN